MCSAGNLGSILTPNFVGPLASQCPVTNQDLRQLCVFIARLGWGEAKLCGP
jgi:hypothetical protein